MALETDLIPSPLPCVLGCEMGVVSIPLACLVLESPAEPWVLLTLRLSVGRGRGLGSWPVSQHPANHSIFGQSPGGRAEAWGRPGISAPSPSPRQGPSSPLSLKQT